jgi:hypothetical protein
MSKPAVSTAFENVSPLTLPEAGVGAPSMEEAANNNEIATLAYRLWEERRRPEGDPERDWCEAERRLAMRDTHRQEA